MHLRMSGGLLAVALAMSVFASTASAGAGGMGPFVSAKTGGTHNYKITVSGSGESVTVSAKKGGVSESYTDGGKASAKKLKSDLGPYGNVNLEFDVKKTKTLDRPKGCHGGKPDKLKKGTWEGKFKFKGEGGFTKASDNSLPGSVFYPGTYHCNGGGGGDQHGVSLSASKFDDTFISFSASKRNPSSKAFFSAFTSDVGGGNVNISYSAQSTGAASTFDYTLPNDATVNPTGPFSGTATLDGSDWTGNLKVKFASKTVNLTGDGFNASLTQVG